MMSNDVSTRKILILAANPKGTDKLRLDEEARDIKEGLRQSKERDRFIIDSEWAVRPRDVRRTILYSKPQIVHFSGHGTEDGGLAFENEIGQVQLVQPDALAGLFKLLSESVECVILNACYSEIQADAISQHIGFVIGMNKEIGDRAAIEFAVGFYDALGAGYSVEIAYEFGCNAIQMVGISEHLTPVLKCKDNSPASRYIITSGELNSVKDTTTRSLRLDAPPKTIYEFVLTGSINEVSRQKLEAIVAHLQEITGDTSLTLLKIESGSIKLVLEGSEEGFRLLESLIASGELGQVLEIPVERVSLLELQLSSTESVREAASSKLINDESIDQRHDLNQENLTSLHQESEIEITLNQDLQNASEASEAGNLLLASDVNTEQRDIRDVSFTRHASVDSITKRLIDVIGSLIGLVIGSLIFVPIAIVIKLDSPGPIFLSQIRCGLYGRQFRIWKFRTMVINVDWYKHTVANEGHGMIFPNINDPRITRVGHFLRRTRLDELPLFWNILRGEMSLVGIRPPTRDEVSHYELHHWQRLNVKPGITGEWQVNGRTRVTDFEHIVRLDLHYQEAWSPLYDLKIIWRTMLLGSCVPFMVIED